MPYSAQDRNQVISLRKKGLSYQWIALRTGISIPTIGIWIRKAVSEHPRKNKDLRFKALVPVETRQAKKKRLINQIEAEMRKKAYRRKSS